MSFHDEFKDLEGRLRQSKPQTEPLPPTLKRQMRQELLEQMTMNENRFTFRKLSVALGGLVILIGIPLFFWLSQMSAGAEIVPGAGSPTAEPNQLDPARPTSIVVGEEVEVPIVELATDIAWLISADVPQGQTVGHYETINAKFGYELKTVQQAKLTVKLADGQRDVLTVEKLIAGSSGTVEIILPLTELKEISGQNVPLELILILESENSSRNDRLYIDFLDGWTVDLTAEIPPTTAEIIQISRPSDVDVYGVTDETVYEINLLTAYTLFDYDHALLVVGYEYFDESGRTSGYEVTPISSGSGQIPITIRLSSTFLTANGEPIEGVTFFARINRYGETIDAWINVFPGNEILPENEQALVFSFLEDEFFFEDLSWAVDEVGQLVLNVTMTYHVFSEQTAEIMVSASGIDGTVFASRNITISEGVGTLTIPLVINRTVLTDNPSIQVTAVLTVGDIDIQDQESVTGDEVLIGELFKNGD